MLKESIIFFLSRFRLNCEKRILLGFFSKTGILTGFIITGVIATSIFAEGIVDSPPLIAFSTGGHSVYHLQPATIDKSGQRVIVSAAFDGTILCHTTDGVELWEKKVTDYFPFDLAVADIDDDGLDEIFVATAGGTVDALDNDGSPLWSFKREAPLYQVCPVRTGSGEWVILAGGIEEEVFSLSPQGALLKSYHAGNVIRHIRKGDIMGDGSEYAAVATTSGGLTGKLSLLLLDPETLSPVWFKTNLGSGGRFFSMIIHDLNHDGKKDIILSGNWDEHGKIYGYDQNGELILESSDPMVPSVSYRMNMLASVNLKDNLGEYIFGSFANGLIIYNGTGKIQSYLKCKYDFSNGAFDPQTSTYYLGSSPSGGDGIYAFHIDQAGWEQAFEAIRPVGNLAKIESNISLLQDQIGKFVRPAYQRTPARVTITASQPKGMTFENINFESRFRASEKYGNRTELWCHDIDNRIAYDKTSEEILSLVRAKEAKAENYTVVAGHGSALYMSPGTLEKIIQVAPRYFQGFLLTEMSQVDSDMEEVVKKILLPLAEKCSAAGKKIILDNKFVFWNGSCYVGFWKDLLLNPRFSNVFIPALEETNCRTQELSLAGRTGLWLSGYFNHWGSRSVTDNACFDRMWEWSSQQVLSYYLRQMILQASMGSDFFSIGILQGPYGDDLQTQLVPIYKLIEKGVVAVPGKNELLSVSDLVLGMKNPSDEYLSHGINGHEYNFNEVVCPPLVFDRLDCYWGAAPLADYDFSSYGYGCERRMLNFLPKNPYGMVVIVPDDLDISKFPSFREKVTTDGQFFYDSTGLRHGPVEFKQTMLEKLSKSASHLPVLVKGDVAWSVVRLDPGHVRVTLVDPGYTDPADRDVEIVLQHLTGLNCTDILSGEKLEIINQSINLRVPAGIFRIVDITHEYNPVSSINDISLLSDLLIMSPNPAKEIVNISLGNLITNRLQIKIYDLSGKLFYEKEISNSISITNIPLNISELDGGIYIIHLITDQGTIIKKLIKN